MNYLTLGQKIKSARKRKGYTQANLAELAGYSVQHISHVETGKTIMSLDCLVRLANSLEISLDDLFCKDLDYREKSLINENITTLIKKSEFQEKSTIVKILTLIKSDIEVYIELAEK